MYLEVILHQQGWFIREEMEEISEEFKTKIEYIKIMGRNLKIIYTRFKDNRNFYSYPIAKGQTN
jgi:hypothetical protein